MAFLRKHTAEERENLRNKLRERLALKKQLSAIVCNPISETGRTLSRESVPRPKPVVAYPQQLAPKPDSAQCPVVARPTFFKAPSEDFADAYLVSPGGSVNKLIESFSTDTSGGFRSRGRS